MCNYTDVMWIGQLDFNERSVSRKTPISTILVQWHERATHQGVGVRHITRSAYEIRTSGREQRRDRDVSMWNVVRDNYVKGMCISCDLKVLGSAYAINQVVDFMRRASQLVAYRRDVVLLDFDISI